MNKYGRLPNLDEIPNVDSSQHIINKLHLDSNSSTSIDNIMSEFGSALINNDLAAGFDMNLASESRTITNLIQKLIKSGNLKENC